MSAIPVTIFVSEWFAYSPVYHILPPIIYPPSSQHKFLTICVTNFHELPCILSLVISCSWCLLPFQLYHYLSFTFCLVLLFTSINITSHLPCVCSVPYTRVVIVVGHTVSLLNKSGYHNFCLLFKYHSVNKPFGCQTCFDHSVTRHVR